MTLKGVVRTIPTVIFAAVAALACYGVFLYLQKELGPDHRYRVFVYFHDVDGLRTDSDVKIGGVPGGQVTDLLVVNDHLARATVMLNANAAPLGADATAAIRPVNLLGEKYIDLNPGALNHPLPSNSSIPVSRTSTPVELDDVLNMLQPDVRARLRILIDESGIALDGQGTNFGQVLNELPPSLDQARALIASAASENQRLGSLITQGNHVLGSFQAHSTGLNNLVVGAARALAVTAARRQQLAATVGAAPATLAQLRTTLGQLSATATQLAPASDELRTSAAPLTETLQRLPAFAAAAQPTLHVAEAVAPELIRLGRQATAPLGRVGSTASQLSGYATHLNPVTAGFDRQINPVLHVMEAWARAIAERDAVGHLFRTHVTVDKYALTNALDRYMVLLGQKVFGHHHGRHGGLPLGGLLTKTPVVGTPKVNLPKVKLPKVKLPKVSLPNTVAGVLNLVAPQSGGASQSGGSVQSLLHYLLSP